MNETVSAYRALVVSFLCYSLVAFIFWGWHQGGGFVAVLASLLHIFMLHVLVWRFSKSLYSDQRRIFSPVSIFYAICLFYFSITFLKYFRNPNFVEFTDDILFRLLGTFLVFLSMIILLRWWCWRSSRYPDKVVPILHQLGEFPGIRFMVFLGCVVAAAGLYFLNTFAQLSPIRALVVERNAGIILLISTSLYYPMLVAALFLKKGIVRYISVSILIISAFVVMVFMGERTCLMISMLLILLFSLSGMKSKSNMIFRAVIYLLGIPLLVIAIAVPLTSYVKKGIDSDLVQTAERGDLSDYAINICSFDNRPSPFAFLGNAVQWAILGDYIDKTNLEKTEVSFQYANRWRVKDYRNGYTRDTIDYPDTVFSSGAYLGGYIGMILFPLIWVGSFVWFINRCSGLLSVAAFLICFMVLCNVELSIWSIVAIWRNYLINTFIMLFVIKFSLYLNNIRFIRR